MIIASKAIFLLCRIGSTISLRTGSIYIYVYIVHVLMCKLSPRL